MSLHGLCSECDRPLALYQSGSVDLHSLSKQFAEAARASDWGSYAQILKQYNRLIQRCDEARTLFHQHVISEHGRCLSQKAETTHRQASLRAASSAPHDGSHHYEARWRAEGFARHSLSGRFRGIASSPTKALSCSTA